MIATATAPDAASFSRMVTALSGAMTRVSAGEWNFVVADGMEITAAVINNGEMYLSLSEFDGPSERFAFVRPGMYRAFEVSDMDERVIGETHGVQAAVSIALDYLVAPLRANSQNVHDAFAV